MPFTIPGTPQQPGTLEQIFAGLNKGLQTAAPIV